MIPEKDALILALLKDINQRFNITIVIITHQMSVVREICSHVAIVKGGEVAEQGTVLPTATVEPRTFTQEDVDNLLRVFLKGESLDLGNFLNQSQAKAETALFLTS